MAHVVTYKYTRPNVSVDFPTATSEQADWDIERRSLMTTHGIDLTYNVNEDGTVAEAVLTAENQETFQTYLTAIEADGGTEILQDIKQRGESDGVTIEIFVNGVEHTPS